MEGPTTSGDKRKVCSSVKFGINAVVGSSVRYPSTLEILFLDDHAHELHKHE